jgi:hypothetical protein
MSASSQALIPRSTRPALITTRQERAAARRFGEVRNAALVRRAEDEAERELVKGRLSDLADLGQHAVNEMLCLEQDYKAAADASPFESALLRGITEDIGLGMRYEVRRFAGGR